MARNVVVANLRRCAGVFLLAALLAPLITACSNAAKTSTVVGLDESINALAGGGVAVMDDVTSRTPLVGLTGTPSAMRFTSWQVRNLVAEANAHGGYLGSDLDALVAPPAGSPGLSVIIGAWLTRNEGALAHYARRFMGDQDYKQSKTIMFPTRSSAAANAMEYVADPLCQHTPPPTTPTPQAGQTGQLPLAPCAAILASGDIGAAYPGAVILNNISNNPEMRALLANMTEWILLRAKTTGVNTNGVEQNPRIAGQSDCAIGPPYQPPADPDQERPPVEAIFVTLPPDGTPVDTAQSNPACLAAMGPELAYFKAECWILNVRERANGPVRSSMIFVFTKNAEYVDETILGSSDAGTVLMRSVLQGLEHGPPPTAAPAPTPKPPPPPPPPRP
jgi:hypothetical protein